MLAYLFMKPDPTENANITCANFSGPNVLIALLGTMKQDREI